MLDTPLASSVWFFVGNDFYGPPMGTNRGIQPAAACVFCGGPMPARQGRGRPAIYCSGACRKAAFEARRTGRPDAFEVKVVEKVVDIEHDLNECGQRVLASPAACRKVLYALAHLAEDGELMRDRRWDSTLTAAERFIYALHPPGRPTPAWNRATRRRFG